MKVVADWLEMISDEEPRSPKQKEALERGQGTPREFGTSR
jgi:hypothetical protein